MPRHDIVVIGGSAGALKPLSLIVSGLSEDFRASLLVVLHTSVESDGKLPEILGRATSLPVAFAKHEEPIERGRVYVAPPDFHMLVTPRGLQVVHGPRESGFRPAVDPLFRTAARQLGRRVVGVILSGGLDDGMYGLSLIKQHGGIAIVQDPAEADVVSMPRSALNAVDADYVLPAARIAATLTRLGEEHAAPRSDQTVEAQLLSAQSGVLLIEEQFGSPSPLTCPDCGGTLWEVQEGRFTHCRCHVGHQYAPETLELGQHDAVERALWSAVRLLEEKAEFKIRLAKLASNSVLGRMAKRYTESAADAHSQAQVIRSLLLPGAEMPPPRQASRRRKAARSARR
jgi:two-component system chemotaxis response regulator CheB